jgi:2-desacetyl-2-hydroxyethyl bacteriochlorophyllide A dehydrogenase
MLVFRGDVPTELALDLPTLKGSFAFPIKYGYASVGRVEDVGASVARLARGDLVFVHHPHQTAYVVPETAPIRLPVETQPEAGVFLANVETAVNVVLDTAPRIGERVLVSGQGVVGLLITQVLRRTGVAEIIVVDPVERRRSLACAVGADRAFAPEEVRAGAISDVTDGHGVDIAIEVSGAPAALDTAIENVTFGGTLIVASWYGTKTVPLHLGGAFHRRRLKLVSSQVSTIDSALQPRWTHARRLAVARDLLGSLELRRLISQRFSIEDAADAYALVDQSPQEAVQVVLTYP